MLNHMVILLFFKRLFSIVATPSYTPADGLGGFPFSTPFPVLVICRLPDHGSSNWCEVICVCISLIISNPEHLSMCLLAICMSSSEKYLHRSSAHFLTVLLGFFLLSCMSCLYVWEVKPLLVTLFANVFLPIHSLIFLLVYGFLCCAKVFKFH